MKFLTLGQPKNNVEYLFFRLSRSVSDIDKPYPIYDDGEVNVMFIPREHWQMMVLLEWFHQSFRCELTCIRLWSASFCQSNSSVECSVQVLDLEGGFCCAFGVGFGCFEEVAGAGVSQWLGLLGWSAGSGMRRRRTSTRKTRKLGKSTSFTPFATGCLRSKLPSRFGALCGLSLRGD